VLGLFDISVHWSLIESQGRKRGMSTISLNTFKDERDELL
jgi:hypothetical protein